MYTGLTTVNAGTLQAGSTQAFGSTTGGMTVNAGATLDLAGFNNTVGALGGSGNVALGGATLTLNAGTATFSGIISGSGGLTQIGRAHVCTPVTNAHLVSRLLLENKK